MKARWLTLFASVPLIVGTVLLQSCGGVGGPNNPATSPGSSAPSQAFLALMTAEQKASTKIGPEACAAATCHGGAPSVHVKAQLASQRNAAPPTGMYATWKLTMHASKGVTCESCHGPGSAHASKPANTDGTPHAILTYPQIADHNVCGQCHGPLHDQYMASHHSELIPSPINSTISNPVSSGQGSRCIMCHGGLTRAQYTEDGVDLGTMTAAQITQLCNDILKVVPQVSTCITCHDAHAKTGNLTGAGKEVQLYHSETLTDSTLIGPGTTPAQYTVPNQICGQCHNGRGTTATDAFLTANTSRPSAHHSNEFNTLLGVGGAETLAGPPKRSSTHALAPGQCATCHMPLSRHTMTVSYENSCTPCHTATDAANRAAVFQAEITNTLTGLATRMANWANTKFGNPSGWDYSSNQTGTPSSQAAIPIEVKRARHNYYYTIISGDLGVHNPAYTRYLLDWANTNLNNAGIPAYNKNEIAAMPMSVKRQMIQDAKAKALKASLD